ncbi:DUF2164 domain-containing protein [Stenotrophomonas sp. Marseille-Q4652]|uniref:DUF2164 domain-containing protein n=1 Tax=Stenotrophomonas sp. Marseille-Q4652 TaxID=2866595 RepID=UPI001CE49170|nr:DUF2164 domain-containing protein [Stenotrophomonas sp. Marseille-Q4652]
MAGIQFSREQQDMLAADLQRWLLDNTSAELGRFEAGFLLDHVSQLLGAYWYNQGVRDAQAVLARRVDDLQEALEQLEQAEG